VPGAAEEPVGRRFVRVDLADPRLAGPDRERLAAMIDVERVGSEAEERAVPQSAEKPA
jgi:hypothetical protein